MPAAWAISHEQAEEMMQAAFGEPIPKNWYAGENLTYDPAKADYSTNGKCVYVLDRQNDTLWGVSLKHGTVQHKGTGAGCFWTEPEKCFEVKGCT